MKIIKVALYKCTNCPSQNSITSSESRKAIVDYIDAKPYIIYWEVKQFLADFLPFIFISIIIHIMIINSIYINIQYIFCTTITQIPFHS